MDTDSGLDNVVKFVDLEITLRLGPVLGKTSIWGAGAQSPVYHTHTMRHAVNKYELGQWVYRGPYNNFSKGYKS